MDKKQAAQKRYPLELKERAVKLVQELRREDPADHTVISRVARQLGAGTTATAVAISEVTLVVTAERDDEAHTRALVRACRPLGRVFAFRRGDLVERGDVAGGSPDGAAGGSGLGQVDLGDDGGDEALSCRTLRHQSDLHPTAPATSPSPQADITFGSDRGPSTSSGRLSHPGE